jgi:hypothetical protein
MSSRIKAPRNLAERADRTREVIARFEGKAFAWDKAATCVHLARAQMRAMGHRPPSVPRFRSPLTARRALKTLGHDNLRSLFGALLPEIPPALLWVGDIVLGAGEPFEAAAVYVGNGHYRGWHDDAETRALAAFTLDANDIIAAYRL